MADYLTQFSCLFDTGSAENAERAASIRDELEAEVERMHGTWLNFQMLSVPDHGPGMLWLHDADGFGEPDHVLAFVRRCAQAFGLKGRWGFTWSMTCSRPRIGAFSGGAHALDLATGATVGWIDGEDWLAGALEAGATAPHAEEAAP